MVAETPPLRVLIADDHAPLRALVREELEDGGLEVCAEADDAWDAVAAALRERPDVCVLDVRMPGGGLMALREIRRARPATRVVMFTAEADEDDRVAALDAGAERWLSKDVDATVLLSAVRGARAA